MSSDIPDFDFVNTSEDFASLFESNSIEVTEDFEAGQKIKGRITEINATSVFVNIGAKSEGIIPLPEVLVDGEVSVNVGDEIEAYFLDDSDGEIQLTVKMSGQALLASLEAAADSKIPVEGKVVEERKGGFTVSLAGQEAFCPYSQIDMRRSDDASIYVGQTFTFVITRCTDRDVVVSRRALLEVEAAKRSQELQETLAEGDIVEGTIRKIQSFGVFVDLGGVDGLIPLSELSWSRKANAEDIVTIGDKVSVKVLRIDWEKKRISLSLRSTSVSPWDEHIDNFHSGVPYKARVVGLQAYGAFVELTPGVEGLLHISQLGEGKRLAHANEVLEEGEELEVYIDSIDYENKKISLVLDVRGQEDHSTSGVSGEASHAVKEGNKVEGKIESIKPYGLFIALTNGKTGLMHTSSMDIPDNVKDAQYLEKNFKIGDEIEVEVQHIEGNRVSLCPPGTSASAESRSSISAYMKKQSAEAKDMGSISSLFDGLSL